MTGPDLQLFDDVPRGYRRNAGVVVVNADGLVFAGQRLDQSAPAWQMPQGGIDEGEGVEQAALRELEEETGIPPHLATPLACTPQWLAYDLPPDLAQRMWGGRYRGQAQKWLAVRFLGDDAAIDLDGHHREFASWRWMRAAELEAAVVDFKRPIYRYLFALFQPYLAA
ncbi:MAG: RNA pyrophosphohydrolase [Alphaproteobacteria bacterium]